MVMESRVIEKLIEAAVEQDTREKEGQQALERQQQQLLLQQGQSVMRQVLSNIIDRVFEELGIEIVPEERSTASCCCGLKAVFEYEEVRFTIFYEYESSYKSQKAKQIRLVAEVKDGSKAKSPLITINSKVLPAIDQEALMLFIHEAGVKSAEFTRNADKRLVEKRQSAIKQMGLSQAFAAGDEDNHYAGMTLHQYYVITIAAALIQGSACTPEQVAASAIAQADALIQRMADSSDY